MRSARNLYRVSLVLAGLGVVAVTLAAASPLRSVEWGAAPADQLMSYCGRLLLPSSTPASTLQVALGLIFAAAMVLAVRSALRQVRDSRRFVRALQVKSELALGETRVLVIAASEPAAFCTGFVAPRVYVSMAALEALLPAELEAVVAHEAHHARRHDPLRILLVRTLADGLFFLPALRHLERRYEELSEMAADEAAVRTTGDPSPLAAALLHFDERGAPGVVVGIAPERVDHLLGETPRWRIPVSLIASAAITVAGLLGLALASAYAAGEEHINLVVLAARSCMMAMTILPVVALGTLAALARRTGRSRSPRRC